MRGPALAWMTILLGFASAEAHAQDIDEVARADLNALTPGIVVALHHNGDLQFLEAYGVADTLGGMPLTPDALFPYPGLSEVVLAMTVEGLHVAGVLDQDAGLSTYLPGLSPGLGRVTLRQLLSNTAGLDDASRMEGESWEQTLDRLDDRSLVSEPGLAVSRSKHSFPLAARAVTTALGLSFPEMARQAVLEPLGLQESTFDLEEARSRGLIGGIAKSSDASGPVKNVEAAEVHDGLPVLFTTARDVVALLAAWNEGRLAGRAPQQLAAATSLAIDPARRFGAGVWVDDFRGLVRISRTGGALGFSTAFHLIPEMGATVLLWSRGEPSPRVARLVLDAVADAAGAPPALPSSRESDAPSVPNAPDPARWAGTYRNGDLIFVLQDSGGELVLFNGSQELPLRASGETRVVATLPDGRVALGFDLLRDDARRRYLYFNGLLYRHEADAPTARGG